MWPDERIVGLVEEEFVPVRVHVQKQAAVFQRLGERYGAQWTPTTLVLDADGTERHRVELRFEFFNLLNHTNFANPSGNIRSATFGILQGAADPRILQFAAKYSF